ncbi:MAG: hypothetical protein ACP5FZ_06665 [Fidelibacterota bacterium]
MNISASLFYFIPELILLLNILILFFFADIRQKRLLILLKAFLLAGFSAVIILNIGCLADLPRGLFSNHFVRDPFASLFGIVLVILFFVLNANLLCQFQKGAHFRELMNRTLSLMAVLLLVKANSLTALVLCFGLIFISHTLSNEPSKSENSGNFATMQIHLLSFGMLLFGFWIIHTLSGTFYFSNMDGAATSLYKNPVIACYLFLLLTTGFGLYGILIPFYGLHNHRNSFNGIWDSGYFLPLLGLFATLIRLMNILFPENTSLATPSGKITVFAAGLSTCLMLGANLYYLQRKNRSNLFNAALVIHYAMTLIGLTRLNPHSAAAVIYFMLSATPMFAGITLLRRDNHHSGADKYLLTIFYLGLLGLPGTSGFAGRFLLMKTLLDSGISIGIIIISFLFSVPLVFYFCREIIGLYTAPEKPAEFAGRDRLMPIFLALVTLATGIFWEPFFEIITKTIVFFP